MVLMKTTLLLFLALSVANALAAPERIAPDNVHRLAVAWTYDTRDPIESLVPGGDSPLFEATPLYVAGRLSCRLRSARSLLSMQRLALRYGESTSALHATSTTAI